VERADTRRAGGAASKLNLAMQIRRCTTSKFGRTNLIVARENVDESITNKQKGKGEIRNESFGDCMRCTCCVLDC
jgi:hypothetical protein